MFLVITFLGLAALLAALFPDWSWPIVVGLSLAGVLALRFLLMRPGRKADKEAS